MARALFPGVLDYSECRQSAHQILGYLIGRGNRVARARKSELLHLESLFEKLVAQVQQQGHQTLHLSSFPGTDADFARRGEEGQDGPPGVYHDPQAMDIGPDPNLTYPRMTGEIGLFDELGISSEAFLSIVQQMGDPETLPHDTLTLG